MAVPPIRPEPRRAYEIANEAARIDSRGINPFVAILVLAAVAGGMRVLLLFFSH